MATTERKVYATNAGYNVLLASFIENDPLIGATTYYTEYQDYQFKSDIEVYGIGSPVTYPYDAGFFDNLPTFVSNGVMANSGPTYSGLVMVDAMVSLL